MSDIERWHAEVRVDIRRTERQACLEGENALRQAKAWLAKEMVADFDRYGHHLEVRERMHGIAEDRRAYGGAGKGWEGWFISPVEGLRTGLMVHYRLTPCDGDCELSEEKSNSDERRRAG